MGKARHIRPDFIYEVTNRTIDRTLLLRPSEKVNETILGVIAHAQKKTGVHIFALVFMSSHYHMLLGADDAEQMARFMRMVNGNITRKLNDLHDRTGAGWAGRFHSIVVANDPETQESRLRYIIAHGVKENLVRRVEDWPGANSVGWLLRGERITGIWMDFTARYYARRRVGYVPVPGEFEREYEVFISVLPCWTGLSETERRARVAQMVRDIEAEAAPSSAELEPTPEQCSERVTKILATNPYDRLARQAHKPAPWVHSVCDAVRRAMRRELMALYDAYTEASQRYRAGDLMVAFPAGTFRPGGGFVPLS